MSQNYILLDNTFTRFDGAKAGVLTAEDFRKMWRDSKELQNQASSSTAQKNGTSNNGGSEASLSFEAGQIFSAFDKDGDGRLSKVEFESLVKLHPELLKLRQARDHAMDELAEAFPSPSLTPYPFEVISGRLLTHYDETAAVAIPSSAGNFQLLLRYYFFSFFFLLLLIF